MGNLFFLRVTNSWRTYWLTSGNRQRVWQILLYEDPENHESSHEGRETDYQDDWAYLLRGLSLSPNRHQGSKSVQAEQAALTRRIQSKHMSRASHQTHKALIHCA